VEYLDIDLMLAALREQPDAFFMSNGWLTYRPSRHRFKVQIDDKAIIGPKCADCDGLSVCEEQGCQLYKMLESWREEYWVPREISQRFGLCVRPASPWRRWLHKVATLRMDNRLDGALAIYAKAWAEIGQIAPRRDDQLPPPRPAKPNPPLPSRPSANTLRELEDMTM
jgi:hypothetical protein